MQRRRRRNQLSPVNHSFHFSISRLFFIVVFDSGLNYICFQVVGTYNSGKYLARGSLHCITAN